MDASVSTLYTAERREARQQSICRAEYTHYPRVSGADGSRTGFTLDESPSGMCLSVDAPVDIGSLLCVRVQSIDGRSRVDTVARVVWCRETKTPGYYRVGLSKVAEAGRKMLFVRPGAQRDQQIAESA